MQRQKRGDGTGGVVHSVVVYGPQGCGKSRCANRLADRYGLRRVVDDEAFDSPTSHADLLRRHRHDSLILVQSDVAPVWANDRHLAGVRVRSFADAMKECGLVLAPVRVRRTKRKAVGS